MATLRAQAAATVSLRVVMAETGLSARNLAAAAQAPGATAMADALPATRGLAQAAGAVTGRTPATAEAKAGGPSFASPIVPVTPRSSAAEWRPSVWVFLTSTSASCAEGASP